MKNNTVRAFIAIEISDEAKKELARIIDVLKKSCADVKWSRPDSIHLTLKFLGNVTEEKISDIATRLKSVASELSLFEFTLDGIGVFPDWSYSRVFWVGIGKGSDRVKDIAKEVENLMEREGFNKEKRSFMSHLTLGRVRTTKNKDKLKKLTEFVIVKPVLTKVSKIVFFKSILTPTGAEYTPLYEALFKKN